VASLMSREAGDSTLRRRSREEYARLASLVDNRPCPQPLSDSSTCIRSRKAKIRRDWDTYQARPLPVHLSWMASIRVSRLQPAPGWVWRYCCNGGSYGVLLHSRGIGGHTQWTFATCTTVYEPNRFEGRHAEPTVGHPYHEFCPRSLLLGPGWLHGTSFVVMP
jgi:hypothetical protein